MEIVDNLFELMGKNPTVSLIGIFVSLILLGYLLRDQILQYVKQKLSLYTEAEIIAAVKATGANAVVVNKNIEFSTNEKGSVASVTRSNLSLDVLNNLQTTRESKS